MVKRRGDERTLDLLLDWQPPEVVRRYDDQRVRTATLRSKIARAVSETLSDAAADRAEIARRMSAFLDEEVSKHMLDAYASEAREEHTIPYVRLLALVHATGDARVLQLGAEMFGHLVVEDRFMKFIELGLKFERSERIKRLDAEWDAEIKAALKEIRSGWL